VRTPVILDCDPGTTMRSRSFALASPEIDLLGVTTTYGNQTLEKTTANALRVLELVERTEIPVAAGADGPLGRDLVVAAHVHGESGLDGRLPRAGSPAGSRGLHLRGARQRPRRCPHGPLTNVARYLAAHGGEGIDRVVAMGGSIAEGNITPAAEFNVWCDPEAAQEVFRSGLDVTMIGLDVTHKAILGPEVSERLRAAGRVGAFVAG
jgi:inosine-uridine nucleoside N-ribohydrolase